MGTDGLEETIWVDVRRPTTVYRLPTGTHVTVIGREGRWGVLRASRVEVPELDVLH